MNAEDAVAELRAQLESHPADRFPVQHATAQFHLGTVLANLGRLDEAESALVEAAKLFRDRLPVEEAKSLNSLGAVLRAAGRPDEAGRAFGHAAAVFRDQGMPLELGAAIFNEGLVARDAGDAGRALDLFAAAGRVFDPDVVPAQAAAARRELGATLLLTSRPDEAIEPLAEAVALAESCGDRGGAGAASNTLGLSHLAAGRATEAAAAFRHAVHFDPRGVRPAGHAMAKANLALAEEQLDRPAIARLAARQALAVAEADQPVRAQASAVLKRLGDPAGDLPAALAMTRAEDWPGMVREELTRWAAAPLDVVHAEMAAWIDSQLARSDGGIDLSEALLGALLELPTDEMQRLIAACVAALEGWSARERERFRTGTASAMARFHVPQLLRLQHLFTAAASELGHEERWG